MRACWILNEILAERPDDQTRRAVAQTDIAALALGGFVKIVIELPELGIAPVERQTARLLPHPVVIEKFDIAGFVKALQGRRVLAVGLVASFFNIGNGFRGDADIIRHKALAFVPITPLLLLIVLSKS